MNTQLTKKRLIMLAAIYITSFAIILTIWSVAYLLEKKLIEIKKELENLKQKL